MKSLQIHLTEYIAARRTLGTRLEAPAKTLRHLSSSWLTRTLNISPPIWLLSGRSSPKMCSAQPGLENCPWFVSLPDGSMSSSHGIRSRLQDY